MDTSESVSSFKRKSVEIKEVPFDETGRSIDEIKLSTALLELLLKEPVFGRSDYSDLVLKIKESPSSSNEASPGSTSPTIINSRPQTKIKKNLSDSFTSCSHSAVSSEPPKAKSKGHKASKQKIRSLGLPSGDDKEIAKLAAGVYSDINKAFLSRTEKEVQESLSEKPWMTPKEVTSNDSLSGIITKPTEKSSRSATKRRGSSQFNSEDIPSAKGLQELSSCSLTSDQVNERPNKKKKAVAITPEAEGDIIKSKDESESLPKESTKANKKKSRSGSSSGSELESPSENTSFIADDKEYETTHILPLPPSTTSDNSDIRSQSVQRVSQDSSLILDDAASYENSSLARMKDTSLDESCFSFNTSSESAPGTDSNSENSSDSRSPESSDLPRQAKIRRKSAMKALDVIRAVTQKHYRHDVSGEDETGHEVMHRNDKSSPNKGDRKLPIENPQEQLSQSGPQKSKSISSVEKTSDKLSSSYAGSRNSQTGPKVKSLQKSESLRDHVVITPPPELYSFTPSGQVVFSDVILNGIRELMERHFTHVYILVQQPSEDSSSPDILHKKVAYRADRGNSDDFLFTKTSFPLSKGARKKHSVGEAAPEMTELGNAHFGGKDAPGGLSEPSHSSGLTSCGGAEDPNVETVAPSDSVSMTQSRDTRHRNINVSDASSEASDTTEVESCDIPLPGSECNAGSTKETDDMTKQDINESLDTSRHTSSPQKSPSKTSSPSKKTSEQILSPKLDAAYSLNAEYVLPGPPHYSTSSSEAERSRKSPEHNLLHWVSDVAPTVSESEDIHISGSDKQDLSLLEIEEEDSNIKRRTSRNRKISTLLPRKSKAKPRRLLFSSVAHCTSDVEAGHSPAPVLPISGSPLQTKTDIHDFPISSSPVVVLAEKTCEMTCAIDSVQKTNTSPVKSAISSLKSTTQSSHLKSAQKSCKIPPVKDSYFAENTIALSDEESEVCSDSVQILALTEAPQPISCLALVTTVAAKAAAPTLSVLSSSPTKSTTVKATVSAFSPIPSTSKPSLFSGTATAGHRAEQSFITSAPPTVTCSGIGSTLSRFRTLLTSSMFGIQSASAHSSAVVECASPTQPIPSSGEGQHRPVPGPSSDSNSAGVASISKHSQSAQNFAQLRHEIDDDSVTSTNSCGDVPLRQWTCADVSRWLTFHGLGRFASEFADIDGPSMVELVHCFSKGSDLVQEYLRDLGCTLAENFKLSAMLRALSNQTGL